MNRQLRENVAEGILGLECLSFTDEQLSDNFQSIMGAINKAKPSSVKGQFIKSAVLTSTMGPGVKLNVVKITQ